LRTGLRILFPRYYSLQEGNITWRLTETSEEGLHLDYFDQGAPIRPDFKARHRVKIFINVDSEARRWRVSHDLPEALKRCRVAVRPRAPGVFEVGAREPADRIDGNAGARGDFHEALPPDRLLILDRAQHNEVELELHRALELLPRVARGRHQTGRPLLQPHQ